jgi:hypothetical protein
MVNPPVRRPYRWTFAGSFAPFGERSAGVKNDQACYQLVRTPNVLALPLPVPTTRAGAFPRVR